jgi:hypothetical protein
MVARISGYLDRCGFPAWLLTLFEEDLNFDAWFDACLVTFLRALH